MKQALKNKVFKVIPLWAIITVVISTGVVFGAFSWISNQESRTIEVLQWEIELDPIEGSPHTGLHVDERVLSLLPYTIHDREDSTGYLFIEFIIADAHPAALTDIDMYEVSVSSTELVLIAGYPKIVGTNLVNYLYGSAPDAPYSFTTTSGNINIEWYPRVTEVNHIGVRITKEIP